MADLHWQWTGAAWVAYTGGSGGSTADLAILTAAVATKLTTPTATGLFVCLTFKPTDPADARPAGYGANVIFEWDLGVGATTPPVNMGADDYWLS